MIGDVAPQPELGELQHGQPGRHLHPERERLLGQGGPDLGEQLREIEPVGVDRGGLEHGEVELVGLAQLLGQAEVGRGLPGVVGDDLVATLARHGPEVNGHEHERRPQLASVVLPDQLPQREVQGLSLIHISEPTRPY